MGSNIIKSKLAYLGYTQEQLAKYLNVTPKTMSKYINTPKTMTVGVLVDIAIFLHLSDEEVNEVVKSA